MRSAPGHFDSALPAEEKAARPGFGPDAERADQRALEFVELVKHVMKDS